MSDDLDALLARLDARTQAFTGHHIDLEREAAAAIRELRDEPLGQRGDYWRDRAQEMERDLDAARIDLRKVNEYNGNLAQELHDARAEVERLKDPDGDHHYMKRLLAQERERARIAELCECGEPECIKQQVTEQRLRAERAEALGRELAGAGRGADWVLALMKDQIDHEDPDVVAAEAALSAALARAKDAGWL